ncbi:MAG: hypothetical protein IH863_08670, partial [Chloroflexi bacterium]|nr:hypothetical protein [Chloroflexota bacterium]
GGTDNVTVAGNTVSGCLIGVAFAPALGGPLTIVGNVITDPQPRRGEGPAMFKAGDDSTGEVRIYHNSFFAGSTPADGFKQTNPNLQNIHLLNNAIYAGRYVWETYSHTGTVTADYDALVTADGDRFLKWDDTRYYSLAEVQTSTGQETHGITASDFAWDAELRPLAGSPLIDAGVIIPGVNDGYSGAAPDIGAIEFGAASPTPTPTLAPTATPAPTDTSAPTNTPGPTPTPAASATPTATAPAPSGPPQPPPQAPTVTPTPTATPPAPTLAVTPAPTATPGPAAGLRPGDVNCDGAITPVDALLLLQAAAGLPPTGCAHLTDLDCDGALTAGDARAILMHLVEIVSLLPATCPQAGTG